MLNRILSGFGFHSCNANRIRIRNMIPTSWIRTGVGFEKTWVRRPLEKKQRWHRIRRTGIDSHRILRFSFWPGIRRGVKNLWKTRSGPGSGVTFQFLQQQESALEMARAANSPVFGPSATVLKQSASNFFSDDVTPGRYSLLAKNFCFLQSFII